MSEENIKIGQILKTFRLKKKYTIEKISYKTKISIQNIENIDELTNEMIISRSVDNKLALKKNMDDNQFSRHSGYYVLGQGPFQQAPLSFGFVLLSLATAFG